MEADGVRCAPARDEPLTANAHLRELAGELQDKPIEALVGHEQIRAESDRRDLQAVLAREAQCFLELAERLGPRECARNAAGAERREA
jgi:hypothetical protein